MLVWGGGGVILDTKISVNLVAHSRGRLGGGTQKKIRGNEEGALGSSDNQRGTSTLCKRKCDSRGQRKRALPRRERKEKSRKEQEKVSGKILNLQFLG